jgi:hypothetical protein
MTSLRYMTLTATFLHGKEIALTPAAAANIILYYTLLFILIELVQEILSQTYGTPYPTT